MTLLLVLLACDLMSEKELNGYLDPDGDGVLHPDDCDDGDPTVGTITWYADDDDDGFGDPTDALTVCAQPSNYVDDDSDCDDSEARIHPGATEECDGQDQDCDAVIDEGGLNPRAYYRDDDGDGFGLSEDTTEACAMPSGYAAQDGDCDDVAPEAYPGAEPVCGDGLDNDCDGEGDCGLALAGEGRVGEQWIRIDGDGDYPLHGGVARAADFSGDGVIDLLVASREGRNWEGNPAGAALLFTGPLEGPLTPEDAAFALVGEYSFDDAAAAISAADLDGDGHADAVLGAPSGYADDQGVVYITLGPIREDIDLAQATSVIRLYSFYEGDALGAAMHVADLDDNGAPDLIVGAPGTTYDRGAVHFIEGPIPRRSTRIDELRYGSLRFSLPGARLGEQVNPAGDVDGDGQADLLFPMPEYGDGLGVLLTALPSGDVELNDLFRATFADFGGQARGFATTLTGAGDVDGDGFADVILAAPEANQGPDTQAGIAWLLPGDALRRANGEVMDHERIAIATFSGDGDNAKLGAAALGPGDLNSDGNAELLLGAPGLDNLGAMLLYQGPLQGALTPAEADYAFRGVTNRTELGATLTDIGDVDGFGLPELVIAAPNDQSGALFILPTDGL